MSDVIKNRIQSLRIDMQKNKNQQPPVIDAAMEAEMETMLKQIQKEIAKNPEYKKELEQQLGLEAWQLLQDHHQPLDRLKGEQLHITAADRIALPQAGGLELFGQPLAESQGRLPAQGIHLVDQAIHQLLAQ